MNITSAALKRPITTLMFFIALAAIGLIAMPLIPLETEPEVDFPGLAINIPYPNASAKEVETEIVRPVEEAISTMSGIKEIFSNSNRNGGGVFVLFNWDSDMDGKKLEARAKIDAIRGQLPLDIEYIPIQSFSSNNFPILNVRISTDRDISNAYQMLDRNIVKRLTRIEGVASVRLDGVYPREIKIDLNADRLASHNINIYELRQQLQRANFSISAGEVRFGEQNWIVRSLGELKTLEDIGNILISNTQLKLSDIADINFSEPEKQYGRHLNGDFAIGVSIEKASGANLVEVAEKALTEIDQISSLPEMQGIDLFVMDNLGEAVEDSLKELVKAGMIGAGFAFIVLLLFLREPISTAIVALSVPFCLLITIAALYFAGYTLNLLTLMGMMLAIGMLVDNSVVVTENIFRKRAQGQKGIDATSSAVKEVGLAITAGTATSIIVFAPIIFGEQNIISLYLGQLAFTIIVALLASLLIAQTMIPVLTSMIKSDRVIHEGKWMQKLSNRYARTLRRFLQSNKLCLLGLFIIFFITAIAMPKFKMDFGYEAPGKRLFLRYNIRGVYPLEKTEETVNKIEDYLFENKDRFDIESIYSFYSTDRAESTIILDEYTQQNPDDIKKLIEDEVPEIIIGSPSFERQRRGGEEGYKAQLYGDSTERLRNIGTDVIATLRNIDGLINVYPDVFRSGREIQIKIDNTRAAQLELNPTIIASSVSTALRGDNLRRIRTSDGEIALKVEFDKDQINSINALKQIPIFGASGQRLALEQVADITTAYGSTNIRRRNRRTNIGISADFAEGADVNKIREEAKQLLDTYNFPPGYGWGSGGNFDLGDMEKTMLFNVLMAIPLILIVMAALFESLLYPWSIITSIGFSFIGVILFFAATGTTFEVMAAIGGLILIGIVVNNGIVLIEHVNYLREQGLARTDALVQGGKDRLRPILMTVITTVLGLVPLAINTGPIVGDGGSSYSPMARTIIGGLIFSTIVSLVIVPVVYAWLDNFSRWRKAVRKRTRLVFE